MPLQVHGRGPDVRYLVRLSVDGQDYEQPFEILKDASVRASDADLRAQFELMVDVRDRFSEVADALIRAREVRALVEDVVYPEAHHGIRRPSYQKDLLERFVGWFDKYVKR